jgi:hypothetical protein
MDGPRQTRRRLLQGGAGTVLGLALAGAGARPGAAVAGPGPPAHAEPGELRLFARDYVPKGWLGCTGEKITRSDHPDLVAAIGDRFGGADGEVRLPDLRSRALVGRGDAPGGASYKVGDEGSALAVRDPAHRSLDARPHIPDQHLARAGPDARRGPSVRLSVLASALDRLPRAGALDQPEPGAVQHRRHPLRRRRRRGVRPPDLRSFTPVGQRDPPDLPRTPFAFARTNLHAGGRPPPAAPRDLLHSHSGEYPSRPQ